MPFGSGPIRVGVNQQDSYDFKPDDNSGTHNALLGIYFPSRSEIRPSSQYLFRGLSAAEPGQASRSHTCASCHSGQFPLPFPTPLPFPQPFALPPVFRNGWPPGGGRSEDEPNSGENSGRNPPQCAIRNDARICNRQPSAFDRQECFASAAEREAYCISSGGEVGRPALRTYRRDP
jgi:hypothetical protein